MNNKKNGRLIILAGPSCVGKSPLARALARFHPELWKTMKPLVLYNSRLARPEEVEGFDYYFRASEQIENLKKKDQFVVIDARGDLQALDLKELSQLLSESNVFFEGNPFIGHILQTHPALKGVNRLSVFMSPLSRDEILYLKVVKPVVSLPDIITDIMRRKLLRRTQKQKNELSHEDIENIERRASSTYQELQYAHFFQYVLPNHDGEDSDNWEAFNYPLGDARVALNTFVALLKGEVLPVLEKWEEGLIT